MRSFFVWRAPIITVFFFLSSFFITAGLSRIRSVLQLQIVDVLLFRINNFLTLEPCTQFKSAIDGTKVSFKNWGWKMTKEISLSSHFSLSCSFILKLTSLQAIASSKRALQACCLFFVLELFFSIKLISVLRSSKHILSALHLLIYLGAEKLWKVGRLNSLKERKWKKKVESSIIEKQERRLELLKMILRTNTINILTWSKLMIMLCWVGDFEKEKKRGKRR